MRAGYTACVQDEVICVADARLRKGVYTPKSVIPDVLVRGLSRHHLTEWRVGPTQIFLAISCRFRHK